VNTELNTGRFP